jgi:hypothetical protein
MGVTAFLSMWINNSASANIMIPTALAIVSELQNHHHVIEQEVQTNANDNHRNSTDTVKIDFSSKKHHYLNIQIVNRNFFCRYPDGLGRTISRASICAYKYGRCFDCVSLFFSQDLRCLECLQEYEQLKLSPLRDLIIRFTSFTIYRRNVHDSIQFVELMQNNRVLAPKDAHAYSDCKGTKGENEVRIIYRVHIELFLILYL